MITPDYTGPTASFEAIGTSATATTGAQEKFRFTGSGSEYFRIWIVNLLLTIVTLGIYSAWAKVRRTRYFYDNTKLAGTSFDYHGSPAAILRGRVVAVLFLAAYNIALRVSDTAGLIMLIVLGVLMPWLLWKSLQFRLYNSSYRGIRFSFAGSAGKVYFVYLLLPIFAFFSFYLLAPFAHQRIKKFQHEESRYGNVHFSFHAGAGRFYKAYLIALGIALGGVFAIAAVFGSALFGVAKAGLKHADASALGTIVLFVFVLYAWIFSLVPIFLTLMQNLIWNHTKLGEHQFKSSMKAGRMCFIAITNIIGIMVTLGLFIPFAHIRTLKYRIESMSLMPSGSLDEFLNNTQAKISATGDAMADLLDFDLSL